MPRYSLQLTIYPTGRVLVPKTLVAALALDDGMSIDIVPPETTGGTVCYLELRPLALGRLRINGLGQAEFRSAYKWDRAFVRPQGPHRPPQRPASLKIEVGDLLQPGCWACRCLNG